MKELPHFAITGKKRAGKDVVVAYLVQKHGYTRVALADGIRKLDSELSGEAAGSIKNNWRLQELGRVMRELYGRDFWIRQTIQNMREKLQENPEITFAVSDMRFPLEAETYREEGFVLIRINASEDTRIRRMKALGEEVNEKILNHETEMHVDSLKVDYEIDNNGSEEALFAQIDRMVQAILNKRTG
ncbi:hypothetical protein [Ammoniphilus sp. 3BR4]|uniref:hypothetical protein n=1 Tax=Ammoniphilus sp. 3BR4 TaxID=3158265 RepID=UPI0034661A1F